MSAAVRSRRTWALAIVATLLALCAPLLVPSSAHAAATTDYRIGDSQPIDSINPFNEQNEISYDVTSVAYDLLLNYSTSNGAPDPTTSLATTYASSDNGLTWTFTLRRGVVWSDGLPFTSADVKWTYDAVRDNTTNVMNAYLANVKSVDAPGPYTIVLHMSAPDVRIPSVFIPILPKHIWKKYPVAKLDSIQPPLPSVTTAPFVISSYQKNGTTILTPNPHYRGTPPRMSRVLITNYTSPDGLLRDIKLGSLDMVVDGDPRWKAQLANNADIHTWSGSAPGFAEIAFNSCPPQGAGLCTKPGPNVKVKVVQDHAIREALALAINRPAIAQANYAGQSQPAYGLISPYYSQYYRDLAKDPKIGYTYNVAKAKKVLADGGWDCASGTCVKDGTKAEFTLYARTNDPQGQSAMRRVVAYAKQVGIDINLQIVTEDALNNKIYAPGPHDTYDPDYDAFYWAWTGDTTPDFDMSVLTTGSDWSDSYYSNKQYDALVAKALQTESVAKRSELFYQAELIAMTDLPYIPIVYSSTFDLTRTDTWHNYQPSPAGPAGSPIGTNAEQLTALLPGPAPQAAVTTSSGGSGVPWPAALLVAVFAAGAGALLGRRSSRVAVPDWTDE